jgi:hypothetical protein
MLFRFYVQEHTTNNDKLIPLGRPLLFQAMGSGPTEALLKCRQQVKASDLRLPKIRFA